MRIFKVSTIFLFGLLLVGASPFADLVFAQAPYPVEIQVPDGMESGDTCPPLLSGHISVCGKVSSISTNETLEGVQQSGNLVEGVTVALYLGARSLGIFDTNATGEWGGKLTGLYSYNVTNADGEYALPVPTHSGTSGFAFLAFLCGDELKELYMVDTSKNISFMNVSLGVGFSCAPIYKDNIPAPPLLEYIDRNNPLFCGDYTVGGPAGVETSSSESVRMNLFRSQLDDQWHTGWIEGEEAFEAAIPNRTELSRKDLEGFTDSWMSYSMHSLSSLNCGLTGCYYTGPLGDASTGQTIPSCESIEKCNTEFPVPSYCKGPGIGLASPSAWGNYIEKILEEREHDWESIPICKDGADVKTLKDFIDDKGRIKDGVDDTFPLSLLINTYGNRFLATTYKNRPSDDSYKNEKPWGADDCDIEPTFDGEFGREDSPDGTDTARLPFKACYKSRLPHTDTYSAQKAVITTTDNIFATRDEYDAVIASVLAPGEILGQTDELWGMIVNPAVDYDKVGGGYWRLGIMNTMCGGDAHDMEDGIIENPVGPSGYEHPSGYKHSTADTRDDKDKFKDYPIQLAERVRDDSGLISVFGVHQGNWEDHIGGCVEKRGGEIVYRPPACSTSVCDQDGDGETDCCEGFYCKTYDDGSQACTETASGPPRLPVEYKYNCNGDVNRTSNIDTSVARYVGADSMYGAQLMTSALTMPPLDDCEEDGVCFVGNAYVMDTKAEFEADAAHKQGYGVKITGEGGPGEIYYFDQMRRALAATFIEDASLNNSFVVGTVSGSFADLDCIAEATGRYVAGVMSEVDSSTLTNIRFLSPAFNMVSPFTQEMITKVAIAAGSAWDKLDGIAGNIYNLPGITITQSVDTVRTNPYVGSRHMLLTETGFYPPDGDRNIGSLAAELGILKGQSNMIGAILFNAFGTNPDPNFVGHVLSDAEVQEVCAGGCAKTGVNSASWFQDPPRPNFYDRADGYGMGFALEITNNDMTLINSLNDAITRGITPVVRIGIGDSSGGFDDPQDYAAFLEQVNSQVTGIVYVIVGPNEPLSEHWAAASCTGGMPYIPSDGSDTGDADYEYQGETCDTNSSTLFTNLMGGSVPAVYSPSSFSGITNLDPVSQDAYAQAEAITGVPCAVLAGIHYMEGGNNPNKSLVSGRCIGCYEPDAGRTFYSLVDTAVYAGNLLNNKVDGSIDNTVELITALSRYNGGGNSQVRQINYPNWSCEDPSVCLTKTFINSHGPYAIASSGVPNTSNDSGWLGMSGFDEGWDDPYALNYYDAQHANMSLLYPLDRTHAFDYCSDYPGATRCPPPIPLGRPGAVSAAIYFHWTNRLGY